MFRVNRGLILSMEHRKWLLLSNNLRYKYQTPTAMYTKKWMPQYVSYCTVIFNWLFPLEIPDFNAELLSSILNSLSPIDLVNIRVDGYNRGYLFILNLFFAATRLKGIEQCRLLDPGSLFLRNKWYWILMVLC